jgi:acyl dehydratase
MRFEELAVGQTFDTVIGPVERTELLDFASRYDPQPLHVDENWARTSGPFGDIIASGVHTLALCWGAWVALGVLSTESIGGLALENIAFSRPVRPGDVLHSHARIEDLRLTRKGKGLFKVVFEVDNQHDQRVMGFRSVGLLSAGHST